MANGQKKLALVTGSNSGIGLETARGLAGQGYRVILGCRDLYKAEAAKTAILASHPTAEIDVLALDLSNLINIRSAVDVLRRSHKQLHLLVNNAGVWPWERQETRDGLELTLGVNHFGTFALTQALLPLLKAAAPSRIVTVSSKLHYRGVMAWDDLHYRKRPYKKIEAYNQSKLANVLMTKALARRLEGSGVTAHALHPGVVATGLARDFPQFLMRFMKIFMLSPSQGAACSLYVATAPEVAKQNGAYFENSKVKAPSKLALSEVDQERLWSISEEIWSSTSA